MKIKLFFILVSAVLVTSSNAQKPTSLYSWGDNTYGQLGLGYNANSTNYSLPEQIGMDTNWSNFIDQFIFKSDSSIWSWGYNYDGRLGQGHFSNSIGPQKVVLNNDYSSFIPSFVIKKDGSLWSWGNNSYGRLGLGNSKNTSIPQKVGLESNWVQIISNDDNSLGIKSDGTLWIWGSFNNYYSPKQIGLDKNWKRGYVTKYSSFFVIKEDGSLWSWGSNYSGNLGLGNAFDNYIGQIPTPVRVGSDNNWSQIFTSSNSNTFGIKTDGSLWGWGANFFGELGLNNLFSKNSPQRIGNSYNWLNIVCTSGSAYGIKTDGTLWSWGYNRYGQLGLGDTTDYLVPTQVGTKNNWVQITSNGFCVLGKTNDGSLWAWGTDGFGIFGLGAKKTFLQPTRIMNNTYWKNASIQVTKVIGIKTNGSLWTWGGDNYNAGLGFNEPNKYINFFSTQSIATGYMHTLIITKNGKLYACGRNDSGQLGLKDLINRNTLTQIGNDSNWSKIRAGSDHSLAIRSDSTLWTWGGNDRGQLGLNYNDTIINFPVKIGSDNSWLEISCGYENSFAIKSNGTLWGWGNLYPFYNFRTNIPKQINNDYDWKLIAAGPSDGYYNQVCFSAIKKDNSLWLCNRNSNKITQIGTDKDWESVSVGLSHVIAKKIDGTIWIITELNKVPVLTQCGTASNWKSIEASIYNSYAIKNDSSLWEINSSGIVTSQIGLKKNWISISSKYNHTLGIQNQAGLNAKNTLINKEKAIIYPNPANDILYIAGIVENQKFNIINTLGNNVLIGEGNKISIIDLKPGLYIIVINKIGYKFIKE